MSTGGTASRAELEAQGRTIVEALGGTWSRARGMCRCPAHDDSSPSLSVRAGDTSLLFHCFAGCKSADVLRELRRAGALDGGMVVTSYDPGERREPMLQAIVERLWETSRDVGGTLAEAYLGSRGISGTSSQLRFHPRVQLGPRGEATYHPALLAAVRDDTGVVALQRIFLDPATGFKAAFENPKRLLGAPGRGAVRLGVPGRVLGLAEGFETAMSASLIHGIPVWAVLGNERFGTVSIPIGVERIVLLGDNDAGGRRAAALAEAGLARPGLTIGGMWPPAPHNDWNDVLLEQQGSVVQPATPPG